MPPESLRLESQATLIAGIEGLWDQRLVDRPDRVAWGIFDLEELATESSRRLRVVK